MEGWNGSFKYNIICYFHINSFSCYAQNNQPLSWLQHPAHLDKKKKNLRILLIEHSYFFAVAVSERKYHLVSLTLLQEIQLAGYPGHSEPAGKGSGPQGSYSRTAAQPTVRTR